VPYHGGTTVVGYDARRIRERMPDAPVDVRGVVLPRLR
jgi:hypothetical protein